MTNAPEPTERERAALVGQLEQAVRAWSGAAAPRAEPRRRVAAPVPPAVVPTNAEARRLIAAVTAGRVRHLGAHLGAMSAAELLTVAEGLGIDAATADPRAVARLVAAELTCAPDPGEEPCAG